MMFEFEARNCPRSDRCWRLELLHIWALHHYLGSLTHVLRKQNSGCSLVPWTLQGARRHKKRELVAKKRIKQIGILNGWEHREKRPTWMAGREREWRRKGEQRSRGVRRLDEHKAQAEVRLEWIGGDDERRAGQSNGFQCNGADKCVCVCPHICSILRTKIFILLAKWGQLCQVGTFWLVATSDKEDKVWKLRLEFSVCFHLTHSAYIQQLIL